MNVILAALALSLALGPMGPDPGPAQVKVGPVYLGETVKQVQKALGRGWRGPVYDRGSEQHYNALVYTDGVDQLELYVIPTTDEGEVVFWIVARENRPQGGAFRYGTTLREWRWDLGSLFEMPDASHGWTGGRVPSPTAGDDTVARYRYGHPLAVWFTKNQWDGVDFHMFEE